MSCYYVYLLNNIDLLCCLSLTTSNLMLQKFIDGIRHIIENMFIKALYFNMYIFIKYKYSVAG